VTGATNGDRSGRTGGNATGASNGNSGNTSAIDRHERNTQGHDGGSHDGHGQASHGHGGKEYNNTVWRRGSGGGRSGGFWTGGQFVYGGNGSGGWDNYSGDNYGPATNYLPLDNGFGSLWTYPYLYDDTATANNDDFPSVPPDDPDSDAVVAPVSAVSRSVQTMPQDPPVDTLSEARSAFLAGDYRKALALALDAEVESPRDAKVQELVSLAMFASGEYWAAARRAHSALALAPPSDWNNLYSYYNDVAKYTAQLRKLEKTVANSPNSAHGHFLLGYHYLMIGAGRNAKDEFAAVTKLSPHDKLAQYMLAQLQGEPAAPSPGLSAKRMEPKGTEL
jgi:hypothetical protein